MQLSNPEIRLILFCGALIKVIDFGIDESEEAVCRDFLINHSGLSPSENQAMHDEVMNEIQEFLADRSQLGQRIGALLDEVTAVLSEDGKKLLFDLLHKVADADGKNAPQEAELLRRFYEGLK